MFSNGFRRGVALAEDKGRRKEMFKGWSFWGGWVVRFAVIDHFLTMDEQAELENWLAELYPDMKKAVVKGGGRWDAQGLVYIFPPEVLQEVYDEAMGEEA